ncbi:MAG TPA: short-chain dehydrogenase [Planctomycetaceae bacterium]|nr:short-chain dehydrogenase [Planctomycetaceae bacterium]
MQLQNKVAVITGGGRGIGRAIALAFAEQGASVAVAARTSEQIESVAAEIRQTGQPASAHCCDVTDRASVEQTFATVAQEFQHIDIVVCNAGGGRERTYVGQDDPDAWQAVVEQNLLGTYHVCRAALPYLREAGGGAVINVGSGMGHQARPGNSSYHAAKAGVWMLTRCLAMEVWEDGVAVNELVPGPVATELTSGLLELGAPHPKIPSEWTKAPQDVAPLAVFLATQGRQGPTGQSFSLARRPL